MLQVTPDRDLRDIQQTAQVGDRYETVAFELAQDALLAYVD